MRWLTHPEDKNQLNLNKMPINTITFENTGAPPKKEKKKPWKWDKGLTKREKVKVLRDHHEKIFEGEQVKFPKFVTRCCYLDNTLGEKE